MKKQLLLVQAFVLASFVAVNAQVSNPYTGTPYSGTAVALPATIVLNHYDEGGENVAWAGLTPGGVDAERTSGVTAAEAKQLNYYNYGGFGINDFHEAGWFNYSYTASAGTYRVTAKWNSGVDANQHPKFTLFFSNGSSIVVDSARTSTGWSSTAIIDTVVGTVTLPAGAGVVQVANTGTGNIFFEGLSFENITGISEVANNNFSFSVYPNPTTDFLTVNMNNVNGYVVATVADITGKVVINEKFANSTFELNTSNLSNGLYFVTVKTNGSAVTKKFIKQ